MLCTQRQHARLPLLQAHSTKCRWFLSPNGFPAHWGDMAGLSSFSRNTWVYRVIGNVLWKTLSTPGFPSLIKRNQLLQQESLKLWSQEEREELQVPAFGPLVCMGEGHHPGIAALTTSFLDGLQLHCRSCCLPGMDMATVVCKQKFKIHSLKNMAP
uniref:Uncharacterized protein n=1 Tax=Pipistrellus kuhlii TaxID=59472 RepID=A0A7J7VBS1_PIPKU|nr:hypothetical protein mPipKuh1_008472 [Pipistrellus kuhlii]